jgi:hypothetical protein
VAAAAVVEAGPRVKSTTLRWHAHRVECLAFR